MPKEGDKFNVELGGDSPVPKGHNSRGFKQDSVIPDGIYNLEVMNARLAEGKESKQKYIRWKVFVLDTDEDQFSVNTTLQEGKRWMYKNFMRAFGTPVEDGQKINLTVRTVATPRGEIYMLDEFKGKQMKAHVVVVNGKNEIKRVWGINVPQSIITDYVSDPKNNVIIPSDSGMPPF